MDAKLLELRDAGTFIPMMAVRMRSQDVSEHYLIRRAGYGDCDFLVLFGRIDEHHAPFNYDPHSWHGSTRTYSIAHAWIETHWDEIESGQVVDVEYILGLRATPKVSERLECPESF